MRTEAVFHLVSLICCNFLLSTLKGQMITQPPESITAALGTNATFSCRGIGRVLWQINNTQVQDYTQVPMFANIKVFVPIPRDSFSELTMTATRVTNTTIVKCIVELTSGVMEPAESGPAQLLTYAEPNPPVDLNITVDGLNLMATWNEPFSLQGEELSYIIYVTDKVNGIQVEITINTTTYVLSEPIGLRDCADYMFIVFSNNSYNKSETGVTGQENIPTVPLVMRRSDVWINVSLIEEIQVTVTFNAPDPCPAYPVVNYTFNISDDSGNTTIYHTENTSVKLNGSRHDLVYDQVYCLTIEATNIVGSTPSEEIQFYTTGLQSSAAVLELNGSITVTCTFALGALSAGCRVTIFGINNTGSWMCLINRPNGIIKVIKNFKTYGLIDYHKLVAEAVEIFNGGEVGNITVNATISVPTIPYQPTNPSTQDPAEDYQDVIIGIVVSIFLVLLVLIVATICVIVTLGIRRKAQYSTSYNQATCEGRFVRPLMNEPAYETVSSFRERSRSARNMTNPVYCYSSESGTATSIGNAGYDKIGQTSRNQISESSSIIQVPSPYLMPQPSLGKDNQKIIKEHYEMQATIDLGSQQMSDPKRLTTGRNTTSYINTHVVPTDPQTGYSTLLRTDKFPQPRSAKLTPMDPLYDSIKEKDKCVLVGSDGDKVAAQMNSPSSSVPPSDAKMQVACSSNDPGVFESIRSQDLVSTSEVVVLIDDPETGYSMLRADKVPRLPPGASSVPPYDTIKLNYSLSVQQYSDTSHSNTSSMHADSTSQP